MYKNFFESIQISVSGAVSSVLGSFFSFLPTLIGAILVLVVGILLAKWLKVLVIKVLDTLRFSELTNHGVTKQFLQNAQITEKIELLVGEIVRYLVILISFIASVNLLGLHTVTAVLNGLLSYLPNIFAAVVILVAGVIVAGVVEKLVKGSLGSIDLKLSRVVGKFSSYLTVIFATLAAFSQLGIAQNLINTIFIGFVSMLSLALGLSLGLGSKDLVKNILEDWYKDFKRDLK